MTDKDKMREEFELQFPAGDSVTAKTLDAIRWEVWQAAKESSSKELQAELTAEREKVKMLHGLLNKLEYNEFGAKRFPSERNHTSRIKMTVMREKLQEFERDIALRFDMGMIPGPVHLSGGNEDELIEIFKNISPTDYVFSTHRNHYHALLHGIPSYTLMREIMAGHSMNLFFPEHNFFTSSIVGGILPIATGVAAALKRRGSKQMVWAFVGDMAATMGIFHECQQYAQGHNLQITFVVEDNGLSTNTPTEQSWGDGVGMDRHHNDGNVIRYNYDRIYPHYGTKQNAII